MKKTITQQLEESAQIKKIIAETLVDKIEQAAQLLIDTFKEEKKVLVFGNGGSAADAQHLAGELVGRFKMERRGLPCIALTTDTSILTAVGNDYGYEDIFTRQVEALASQGDVVIGISTSGNSPNVLEALRVAQAKGAKAIALVGKDGGEMKDLAELSIVVPSQDTPRIQEGHITIIHILCHLVEVGLFGGNCRGSLS